MNLAVGVRIKEARRPLSSRILEIALVCLYWYRVITLLIIAAVAQEVAFLSRFVESYCSASWRYL